MVQNWHSLFSERLRQSREELGLSQQELADRAGLSHFTKVSHYETGRERPSLENFRRLALALSKPAGWLLGISK